MVESNCFTWVRVTIGGNAREINYAPSGNTTGASVHHGSGPISGPEDAEFVLKRTNGVGFYRASTMERLLVEQAIKIIVQQYKSITLK